MINCIRRNYGLDRRNKLIIGEIVDAIGEITKFITPVEYCLAVLSLISGELFQVSRNNYNIGGILHRFGGIHRLEQVRKAFTRLIRQRLLFWIMKFYRIVRHMKPFEGH